ncbi:rhomboid family intramembrane serine protease [Flammeovirga yaeyamensis]|uniref:Rhomboid family intramembrane serine protease n=1 Tax=Flammeovirga yaeyamensis TaxID=367791 RepID=A0AAX1N5H6_9BACT|nr:rhomboid family intramembrane serine protease [Flammeovirga yaeyamensis]MBB3701472.1 membrane associated rhomboid family serine protease [Flammeovirga yaeyamensis]NMF38597.1 rhomboid family intramembrane serine protease [Flammeovirga yaeyamensis]QWG02740.1 rhomboid family intramembrane serine protease [Flammeovirga yaeyamensis]
MNFQLTPYVKGILIVNLIVFALANLLPTQELNGSEVNIIVAFLGYHYPKSDFFQIFQPITYMFTHESFRHIFSNMFALVIFGPMLENVLGSKRFFTLYMICGLGGGALYGLTNYYEMHTMEIDAANFITDTTPENLTYFFEHHAENILQYNPDINTFVLDDYPTHFENHPEVQEQAISYVRQLTLLNFDTPMIGASGAIFGILFTFAFLFPNLRLMLLFPPIPIKAKYLVGGYILFEIYELVQNNPGDNVAHLAHLGGVLFAYFLMKKWKYMSYQ